MCGVCCCTVSRMLRLPLSVSLWALLLLLLCSSLPLAESVNYNVFIDERLFEESCESTEDEGNVSWSELLDTHLTTVLDNDFETLYLSGDFIVKAQLDRSPIQFAADISRWERGQWVPTLISLKRNNFCKSLFDPFELWHFYIITQIPKELRICPPKKGHVYTFRNVSNRMQVENMPRWDMEGKLRVVLHFTAGRYKTCMIMYCTVSIY